MTLDDLAPAKRDKIKKIAAQHGAFNIRVFGSVAKGKADRNSDLDLLVDYDIDKIKKHAAQGKEKFTESTLLDSNQNLSSP